MVANVSVPSAHPNSLRPPSTTPPVSHRSRSRVEEALRRSLFLANNDSSFDGLESLINEWKDFLGNPFDSQVHRFGKQVYIHGQWQ